MPSASVCGCEKPVKDALHGTTPAQTGDRADGASVFAACQPGGRENGLLRRVPVAGCHSCPVTDTALRCNVRPLLAARRRILTVGHSYVIGVNRRLAHELELVGAGSWEVVCVAPQKYRADHGWAEFRALPAEPCRSLGVRAFGTRSPHLFAYGPALRELMREPWDVVFGWEEPYVVAGAQLAAWTQRKSSFTFLTFQNIRKRYPPPFSWLERYTLTRSSGWLYSGHSVFEV